MAGWTRARAALAVLRAIVVLSGGGALAWRESDPASFTRALMRFAPRIFPDDAGAAVKYYQRISTTLDPGLVNADGLSAANLGQLLDYFGYVGVRAADVECLTPVELMP